MTTNFKIIPLIDITSLVKKWNDPNITKDDGVAEVVRQLDAACRDTGFFYVKGHGIPNSLIKEVRSISHKYFALPDEEKVKIKLSPESGYRGYQRIHESMTDGIPELQESIDCFREVDEGMYGDLGRPMEGANKWPNKPPELKKLMEKYIKLCTGLSRIIMRGIAMALGGSVDEFEKKVAGDPFWAFRIIGYPAISNVNKVDMQENDIGCGAHTDYGLLTLINQDDDITALQVRNLSGEWISAMPIPDTFVCNIGDMLTILSNGLYKATLHRVVNKSLKYRVCVAYFYEGNFDVAIEPLDVCVENSGGTIKFESSVYGKHLVNKLLITRKHEV